MTEQHSSLSWPPGTMCSIMVEHERGEHGREAVQDVRVIESRLTALETTMNHVNTKLDLLLERPGQRKTVVTRETAVVSLSASGLMVGLFAAVGKATGWW